jgi:glycosyltransferase involved in cell wall biosynthesis
LLTDLAEGLAAQGWQIQVIAAGEDSASHQGVTIHRTGGTDRHGGLLSRAVNYGRFRRAAQRLLGSLVQPGDIVVPMTDPPLLGAAVTALVTARGGRVVPWIQDIYPEILSAHLGDWTAVPLGPLRRRRDRAWREAACCVTLGEDMQRTVAAGGVSAGNLAIVPNWAPRELHTPAPAAAVAARRQAWEVTDKFVVAYSGNLGRVHEFNAVLDAATRLREQRDIVFLFIGNGARFEEVRSAVRARGLANLRLLPPESRENLPAALAAADAHLVTLKPAFSPLVYPSKLAGVLAAARPVLFVGPPENEIARLLAREHCGVAITPEEGVRLAETIAAWHDAPDQARMLGQNGRRVYERRFAFGSALARWQDILHAAAR